MNIILQQDINDFVKSFKLTDDLQNSTFLITGSTGLIGSILIHCLVAMNNNIRVIAPVRDIDKAKKKFIGELSHIELFECNIVDFDYGKIENVDYIIHCAAPTSSQFFVEKPVETFNIIVDGTRALLEYARTHPIKSFVYLSSLEVYGSVFDDSEPIKEVFQGYLDPLSVRSSYPMAKRATENMCVLYKSEYNVPVKIARLTQTTGAGISKDDNRVIAQFTRIASQGQDIILRTKGTSSRPYCYTTDCISGILYILLKGVSGEAYNVANEETYISAKGLAILIQESFFPKVKVVFEISDNTSYAPVTKQKLSAEKLRNLGWAPNYNLKDIISKLLKFFDHEI